LGTLVLFFGIEECAAVGGFLLLAAGGLGIALILDLER
jgi:hypothetical protein